MSMQDVYQYRPWQNGSRDGHRSAPAVLTEGLVRSFGATVAVDGVDLRVERGEVYGFLGPNGAGKSTLVRVLCTLLRPSAGRAVVAGYDVVDRPQEVRLRIGVALQEAALDDRQTGRELLTLQGRLYGLRSREVRRRVDDVLALVDIGKAIDRRIGTYSGGMKRRLDLAAALVHNPEILFLDEPTTGLDPDSRANVWNEVHRLNDELAMTIFLTTQYLEEADALADRVAFISRGGIVAEGPPAVLKHSIGDDLIEVTVDGDSRRAIGPLGALAGVDAVATEAATVRVRTPDGSSILGPVVVELGRTGLQVKEVKLRTPTLDDVFRELTGSHIKVGQAGR
jgi:ABC-2 type transport system ATP-binding protein